MSEIKENSKKQKNHAILNKMNLKFNNTKLEDEYLKNNEKTRKKLNILISILGIILSLIIIIFGNHIENEIKTIFAEKNLKTVEIPILNTTENPILKRFLIYDKFWLLNQTELDLKFNSTIPQNSTIYSYLIPFRNHEGLKILLVSSFMVKYLWYVAPFFIFVNLIIFILSLFSNKNKLIIIFFCVTFIIFTFNFHLLTAILRIYYVDSADPVFLVLSFNLFGLIIFSLNSRVGWKPILITNISGILLEWGLFIILLLRSSFYQFLIYYLSVNFVIRISLIIIVYKNEFYIRNEFYLNKYLHYEKNYLMDLVDNLSQGFLSYNKHKNLFLNKSMKKIIYELNKNNKLRINILKGINNNNDSQDDNKIMFDKILSHLTQINSELPEDIQKIIKNNLEEGFEMNQFFQNILEKKNILNFDNFIQLGIIKIDNTNDSFDNSTKTLQVLFRIITHEFEDDYLEIMFSDVSKIINDEREKTLINARSMYLNKIAHEFRNPLTSLVELSLEIKDEIEILNNFEIINFIKNDQETKESLFSRSTQKIYECIDYSEKLYKTMIHFLKDFSVFSNLKFPCDKSKIICKKFIKCYQCGLSKMCEKCQVCNNCEEKGSQSFNYKLVIDEVLETFNSLIKYEKRTLNIIYHQSNPNHKNERKYIKTNKELFISAFFNLIFHSYKSAKNKTEIKIKITNENYEFYNTSHFEIINEGFEVDPDFLKIIKLREQLELDEEINYNIPNKNTQDNEISSNSFNKNFELYISFNILKKMYSDLKIESAKNCCTFSFKINFSDDEYLIKNIIRNPSQTFSSASLIGDCRNKIPYQINSSNSVNINNLHQKPKLSMISNSNNYPKYSSMKIKKNIISKNKINCSQISNIEFLEDLKLEKLEKSCSFYTKEFNKSLNFQYDILEQDYNLEQDSINNSLGKNIVKNILITENNNLNNENIFQSIKNQIELQIIENSCEFSADDFYNIKKCNNIFRVLLIDDENLIRKTLIRNFNKIQKRNDSIIFEIFEASNCFDAINIIYKNCLENKQFDFIIIDECMPFMKGSTLIKLLKQLADEKNLYKINIISHTAFDTVEKKKFIFDCGADHILGKPVEYSQFEDFIIKLII